METLQTSLIQTFSWRRYIARIIFFSVASIVFRSIHLMIIAIPFINTATLPPGGVITLYVLIFGGGIGGFVLAGYFISRFWRSNFFGRWNVATSIIVWAGLGLFILRGLIAQLWLFGLALLGIDALVFAFAFFFRWLHRKRLKPTV